MTICIGALTVALQCAGKPLVRHPQQTTCGSQATVCSFCYRLSPYSQNSTIKTNYDNSSKNTQIAAAEESKQNLKNSWEKEKILLRYGNISAPRFHRTPHQAEWENYTAS